MPCYACGFHIHATQANHEASVRLQAILVYLECATALAAAHVFVCPVISRRTAWVRLLESDHGHPSGLKTERTLFYHAPIWDKHNSLVFPKHCVAGKVVLQVFMDMECCFYLSRHIYNMLNSPLPSFRVDSWSMRRFLLLALSEAQALLAKSLAPSQTPGEQNLGWLAKAETGACF